MRSRALWQGRADNLCGIYCLLHVIRKNEIFGLVQADRDRMALRALLRSAEKQNLLTADRLAGIEGGYPATELISIFNGLPPRHRVGFNAELIEKYQPDYDGNAIHLTPLFKRGGFAIIDVDKCNHWVCAHGLDEGGKMTCFDPSAKMQMRVRARASSDEGVALIPNSTVSK